MEPILQIRNLTHRFDEKTALSNVSFDVNDGEFLAILGPSGCGKTTILRILIGLLQPTEGTVTMAGRDITHVSPAERNMGIVFQNYALFEDMTVLQNVQYALTLRKDTKKQARQIALRTLEQVGLTDQLHKRPHQLSGGQQQRVAIARTLAMSPDIILLDEPISALDVTNREIMKAELKQLQKAFHATMLFITHDQEEAFFLSDRVMVMRDATIEQLDTPQNIYRSPASDYVREFVVDQLDQKYRQLLRYTGRDCHEA